MRIGAIPSIILVIVLMSALTVSDLQMSSGNPTFIWDQPMNGGSVVPDNKTKPPTIHFYFENSTVSRNNSLSIPIYLSVGDSSTAQSRMLEEIYYQADWLSSNTTIYKYIVSIYNSYPKPATPTITELSTSINLTDVPEGNHTITIYANETGYYKSLKYSPSANYTFNYYYDFKIIGSSNLNFIVDAAPSSSISPNTTPYLPPRNPPHLEPIDYLLPISVILTIIIVLAILIYRWHRKSS
jgi:hypothetical protein